MLTYIGLRDEIRRAPRTYLPALLAYIAEHALKMGCFQPGGVINIVTNVEKKFQAEREGKEFKKDELKVVELTCGSCGASYSLDKRYIHRRCGLSGCEGKLHLL